MNTLLCLGAGYTASSLATQLTGWRVLGTSRGQRPGFPGDVLPFQAARTALAHATHVLVSAAPTDAGDPVLAALDGALRPDLTVLYLSATSVYGHRPDGLAGEGDALAPTTARGRRRAAAEQAWRDTGVRLEIFRLAGIYGPGRSAFDRLQRPLIDAPGHSFARIHVDDAAAVLAAALADPQPGRICNVSDDEPAESAVVTEHAWSLLGRPAPARTPLADAELSPMAASFWTERRTLDCAARRALLPRLTYPTYREGLAAILRARTPTS